MTRPLALLAVLLAVPVAAQPTLPVLYTIENPDPLPTGGLFGSSFQVVGDVDLDGVGDLLIGEDSNIADGYSGGRAYVFSGASGTLVYALMSPLPTNGGLFGASVASLGDLDGDGTADFAVGAPGEPQGQIPGVGRVHVFSGRSGTLLYSLDSPTPNNDGDDRFGFSVVGVSDIDDDGVPDLLVSAYRAFYRGAYPGKLYAFSGSDGELVYTYNPDSGTGSDRTFYYQLDPVAEGLVGVRTGYRKVELFDAWTGLFTDSVDLYGAVSAFWGGGFDFTRDVDGDDISDLLLGYPDFDPDDREPYVGRVFLYGVGTGEIIRTYERPSADSRERAGFGSTVSFLGDVDGDMFPDFATLEYTVASYGSPSEVLVYLVSGDTGAFIGVVDPQVTVRGERLSPVGDVNRDGVPDFAVTEDTGTEIRIAVVSGAPLPVATDTDLDSQLSLAVSPNPVRGTATVRFEVGAPGPIRLSVFDALGREVAVVSESPAAGPDRVAFDASGLPAGVYVARLAAGGRVASRPFVVVR